MNLNPFFASAGGAIVLGGIGYGVWRERRDRAAEDHRQTVDTVRLLVPRSNYQHDAENIVRWVRKFSTLARTLEDRHRKGMVSFAFRIIKTADGKVLYALDSPRDREDGVKSTIPANLEWLEDQRKSVPDFSEHVDTNITLDDPHLPIDSLSNESALEGIFRAMPPASELCIRFSPLFEKDAMRHVEKAHKAHDPERFQDAAGGRSLLKETQSAFRDIGTGVVEGLKRDLGGLSSGSAKRPTSAPKKSPTLTQKRLPHQEAQLKAVVNRYHETREMFRVKIVFRTTASVRSIAVPTLLAALSDIQGLNRFVAKKGEMILSAGELAQFVHVARTKDTLSIRAHSRTLDTEELHEGIPVGYLEHPTQGKRLVRIPHDVWLTHFIVTGKTGSGKSSTITTLTQGMIEDFVAGAPRALGFTFLDPAEDAALTLLSRLQQLLPPDDPKWEKVHYISFSNTDAPVPMNFLQVLSRDAVHELLTRSYGGGASLDEIMDKAIAALQSVPEERHVVGGMVPLLRDEVWRLRVARKIENQLLRQYWEQVFTQTVKPANVAPVERRLNPFISGLPALYFAQPDYALPIRQWMDEGHIVLFDVKALGERMMEMLVGTVIERYYRTALTRPSNTSRTHLLLVDECHRVQIAAMKGIIKETRKFGLGLGMITQSINHFRDDIRQEITDNVSTFLTNQQGPDGSRVLSRLTSGAFDPEYLENIPPLVMSVYTQVRGQKIGLETTVEPPFLSKAAYPNQDWIRNKESAEYTERMDELRALGWSMQKRLAPKNAKQVEDDFNTYLKTGRWERERIIVGRDNESQHVAIPVRRKPTADDLL
ncbi:MAG: hypothetical protein OWR62_13820 [Sulfobacillus thermotolerans]|nr:hypothetical protein [Sulfobacillus thermotolerans]